MLISKVQAYHGRVIKLEALEKLSDKQLFGMMHPSDRIKNNEE